MIVLGIDQGISNLGYCVVSITTNKKPHILASGTITTNDSKFTGDRIKYIYDILRKEVVKYNIKLICIEKLQGNLVRTVGYLNGIIFLLSAEIGAPVVDILPKVVKKYVSGSGNADKDLMIESVKNITDISFESDHTADAFAIAYTGINKIKEDVKVNKKFKKDCLKIMKERKVKK